MTREELISLAKEACAGWWDSFGGSADPEGEWDGLDDSDRDYWCFVADRVVSARAGLGLLEDETGRPNNTTKG